MTFRYRVALLGWPAHVTFQSPSCHSVMRDIQLLIARFESGETRFRKLDEDVLEWLAEEREYMSLVGRVAYSGRVDRGKRIARPEATRSKILRYHTVKTSRLVNGRED